ncbi:MerR family transcriptional regulator [Clostridium sp. MSJ-4]|uniref:MerR family transcriptional regulator n=1 Tax=Clostridium simiarum TaxID=2841506 RepID=A0ABS6F744_9CLOT|nr:MerR family transcriptional regulator [Clostridium simiarum]MBU5593438.1 MerR family transcriptional regulator [Clostridium simiarum]
MEYTVKSVADITGVSIRTLHHYDHIGLLRPHNKTESGYRLYSDSDLEKLQQILFFKELDFTLEEIKKVMNSPIYDKKEALKCHKELLLRKKSRLDNILKSVEITIKAMEGEIDMSKKDMFESFDDSKIEEYRKEVREKYGEEIVDQCDKKTRGYNKDKWNSLNAEGERIFREISLLMNEGAREEKVQKLIKEHYKYINDNFYNCTPEIYKGLGDLYIQDERFTAYYENIKPGLAKFMKEAMHIFIDNM